MSGLPAECQMLDHLDRYDGENYRMVDGGAILLGSGRGRGRREWVIKLVGAGAVRRPASGERRARRQGPGAGVKALPIGRFRPFEGFPGSSFPASASPIRRELFDNSGFGRPNLCPYPSGSPRSWPNRYQLVTICRQFQNRGSATPETGRCRDGEQGLERGGRKTGWPAYCG